jgi:TolA-binding protein
MPPAPRAILAPVAAAPAAGPAPVAATPDLRSPSSPPEADTTSEAVHDDGTWARATLRTALDAIRGGRFDAARSSLASIPQRMPESTYAREAARGRVALYNARKIRGAASDGERARHLARAQRDLGDTMWAELFRG